MTVGGYFTATAAAAGAGDDWLVWLSSEWSCDVLDEPSLSTVKARNRVRVGRRSLFCYVSYRFTLAPPLSEHPQRRAAKYTFICLVFFIDILLRSSTFTKLFTLP